MSADRVSSIYFLFSVFCLAIFFWPMKVVAQDINEVQQLSFGTFAILDNSAAHTIVVDPDNSVAYDPDLIPGTPANRGEYVFTGLPANTTFTLGVTIANPPTDGGVTLDNQTALSTGGGQNFTVSNFAINVANEMITDNNGDATLHIGATLSTSGNGGFYNDGVFNGTYDITLYW